MSPRRLAMNLRLLESLKTGKNGIGPISKFDVSETGVTLAAEVKDFPMEKYFVKRWQTHG